MPELIMSYQIDEDGTMHDLRREGELVRCGECINWTGTLCKTLSKFGTIETKMDFYCGNGRRKE